MHENKNDVIEKILHKYELEIRAHIKMENEYKRIAQETEEKYNRLREEAEVFNEKYNNLITQLSSCVYKNENLAKENEQLKSSYFQLNNRKAKRRSIKKTHKSHKSSDNKLMAHFNPHSYNKINESRKRVS